MSKVSGAELVNSNTRESFKRWALIELVAKNKIEIPKPTIFEVQCTINGVEVDFEELFDRLEVHFEEKLQEELSRLLSDKFDNFTLAMEDAMSEAYAVYEDKMKEAGYKTSSWRD